MTVEVKPNFILISSMVDGYGYFKKKYIGYSIQEAKDLFEMEVEEMEAFARQATHRHRPENQQI